MYNKVNFNAFVALPKYDKLDLVFKLGEFIETRTEQKKQVIIYALDRFFVELYFDTRVNRIVKVNSFIGREHSN